jgi:hypothetical protein
MEIALQVIMKTILIVDDDVAVQEVLTDMRATGPCALGMG